MIRRLMIAVALIGLLYPLSAWADTCETRTDRDIPDFQPDKPAPIICDTHGQLRTLGGRASTTAPGLEEGAVTGNSYDLSGYLRIIMSGSPSGGFGTATAAAPSLSEGAAGSFSFDLAGNARVTLGTLISGEDQTNGLIRTSGGAIRSSTIMTGVTTNTTSSTTTVFSGAKTPMASVTGTGAVTATVAFYGDYENTTTHGEHICTLVLSGTTKDVDYCAQFTKDYPYYHAVTTVVTGTGATVEATIVTGLAAGARNQEFLASGIKTSDALIKTGAGFLQCVIIAQNDAAPTAGTISVNDAVSAGTGTAIFTWVLTATVFTPFQVCPQVPFSTGLYFDFTTTADVNVSASYR